jgi:hypothetical protein
MTQAGLAHLPGVYKKATLMALQEWKCLYLLGSRLWDKCSVVITSSHLHTSSGRKTLSSPFDTPENSLVAHSCTACEDLGWDLDE